MNALLALSRLIDRMSERIGHAVYWLVLVAVLISAANAVVRKLFNYSSNSFLEIQWYLFSLIFLFLAGYTLKNNEHVRIDIISGRYQPSADHAPKVNVPTLIVMGTKDPDFKDPTAEAQWLAEQTHGKVMMVEGAGHYPHVEMIDQVVQPIFDFLKSFEVVYDA